MSLKTFDLSDSDHSDEGFSKKDKTTCSDLLNGLTEASNSSF